MCPYQRRVVCVRRRPGRRGGVHRAVPAVGRVAWFLAPATRDAYAVSCILAAMPGTAGVPPLRLSVQAPPPIIRRIGQSSRREKAVLLNDDLPERRAIDAVAG